MSKTSKSAAKKPTPREGDPKAPQQASNARSVFLVAAANMSWQLAIVVLLPVVAGVQIDKKLGSGHAWLFVGLAVALVGSVLVMWRTMQIANRLPVPKLTAAEKRAIQKQYEEDDNDA